MANIFLALFLFVFVLTLIFGLSIPTWATGVLALIAAVLIAMQHFRASVAQK